LDRWVEVSVVEAPGHLEAALVDRMVGEDCSSNRALLFFQPSPMDRLAGWAAVEFGVLLDEPLQTA
jgi:hypothetical protein